MVYKELYPDGMDMTQFFDKHIEDISIYNSNYHVGLGHTILYAKSDDNNTTEWYVHFMDECAFLGVSYTDEGDILVRAENIW